MGSLKSRLPCCYEFTIIFALLFMMLDPITPTSIHQFLQNRFAAELATQPDQIDIHTSMASYRLDSVVTVTLAVDLEEWLNCSIDPSVFWEFSTIAELTDWLINDYLPTQHA